jgi:GNAT superfamily N-acetyltransferase
MTRVGLRPATAADSEFCYRLHRAAARGYVEAVWGWEEATQRAFHDRTFRPIRMRIIVVDGRDVGSVSVEYAAAEVYLGRLEILPAYQSQGIGSQIIQRLLDEAAGRGQPVLLDVLVVNHRAHALYRRLGFHDILRHGQNNIKIRMRYPPPTPAPDQPPTH